MLDKFVLKIRRRETPLHSFLYNIGHSIQRINIPYFFQPLYRLLYHERQLRISFFRRMATFLYFEPMFRSRCEKVGEHLNYVKLQQNFPYIFGNIQIHIGENVVMHSRSTFSASKVFDYPTFNVGDHTYLGPGLSIGVAKEITIGSWCHIASNVSISDNDGHPIDPIERAKHKPVGRDEIKPVYIGDHVWIGDGAIILKGVTIGDCSIIAARSVVTANVEPYMIVAGNPARWVKKLPDGATEREGMRSS